jgi:raffinose/stachyose/melibiose transport system permease protein
MQKNIKKWILVFLIPTIIIFLLFYAYPLLTVIVTSMTEWKITTRPIFSGLNNYIDLFKDQVFIASLINVFKWLILSWTIYVGIGVLTALLTAKKNKFNRFVKVVYLIPNMISIAALAMTFYFIFQPSFGVVNSVIRAIGFTDFSKNWYYEYDTAFTTVTLTTIFFAGVIMLLVSSEISSVPDSIMESAKVDGAKDWQVNIYIILPMIKNIIGTSLILSTVQVLKVFEVIFLTTRGGPGNQTMNLSLYLYNTALKNNNFGYANAIGTIIIIVGIISIIAINKVFKMESSHYL